MDACQKLLAEHGKHVAIEVPAAMTLDEIWLLINTSERTRKHCMMLENGSASVAIPDFTRGAWNRIKGFRYAFK